MHYRNARDSGCNYLSQTLLFGLRVPYLPPRSTGKPKAATLLRFDCSVRNTLFWPCPPNGANESRTRHGVDRKG